MTFEEETYLGLVNDYMNGQCAELAAALYHYYNLGLAALVVRHPCDDEYLAHAFAILPNGNYFDIQGEQTLKEVTSFSEDTQDGQQYFVRLNITLEALERLAGWKLPKDRPDVLEALEVVKTYLKDDLPK